MDNNNSAKLSTLSETDKSDYIGKGAWSNGEVVVDLYKLSGDTDFSYLYVHFAWEGQMYQLEDMINE